MNDQSAGIEAQPITEQFQLPPLLEKIHIKTNGTPESVKQYFGTLSFDDFSQLLNGLNGFYRNTSGEQSMDGDGKMGNGYMPPDPKDRIPLLKEAFEKAIKEDSPEKCGMVLGMSILTIHPYLDGNGRTSRTIFALLTNGYSGSEKDKTLFAEIGEKDNENEYHRSGSHIIDLDPNNSELKKGLSLADLVYWDLKKIAVENRFGANLSDLPIRVGVNNYDQYYNPESKLSKEEQLELSNIFESMPLAFVACINSFSDELYKKSLRHVNFDGSEYDVISYENIIKDITSEDLFDLRSAFRQVRVDYVRQIMKVTNREDYQNIYQQYFDKLEKWKTKNSELA